MDRIIDLITEWLFRYLPYVIIGGGAVYFLSK